MCFRLGPLALLVFILGCTVDADGKRRPFAAGFVSRPKAVFQPALPTRGLDSDGRPLRLEDHAGKVVLLSFWFSACPPCRALMPHEKKLVAQLPPERFTLLGINADADPAQLKAMETKAQLNYRSIADGANGPICAAWGVQAFPTLVLIDPEGNIRWRSDGPPSEAELDHRIQQLLQETQPVSHRSGLK
jgi:thiol-disulfide isomerase/thioredoxin